MFVNVSHWIIDTGESLSIVGALNVKLLFIYRQAVVGDFVRAPAPTVLRLCVYVDKKNLKQK